MKTPRAGTACKIEARPNVMGHITFLIVDGEAVGEIYGQDALKAKVS